MNTQIMQTRMVIVLAALGVDAAFAAELHGIPPKATEINELDKLVGQPVDIAPWAYSWRADLAVQEKPEAYFIPRRLQRMDRVYRTASHTLPEQELKSIYYQMPDLLKPLPPKPKGQLLAGLLWTGRLADYQAELRWPAGAEKIPSPEAVQVRVYPPSFGWFGWTVDRILSEPEVSEDRRTWTYKSGPTTRMDWTFSGGVDAATEMVAVFCEEGNTEGGIKSAVPSIRVVSPSVGVWKRTDVEIEWGFQAGKEKNHFDGCIALISLTVSSTSTRAPLGPTMTTAPEHSSIAVGNSPSISSRPDGRSAS